MKNRYAWCTLLALLAGLADSANSQTRISLQGQSKESDFSLAALTKPMRMGTGRPAICSQGEMYYQVDAAPESRVQICVATNAWMTLSGGMTLPQMADMTDKVLTTDGADAVWTAPGGDVSGPMGALSVTKLRGRTVTNTAPIDKDVLAWDASSSEWAPNRPRTYSAGLGINIAGDFISIEDAIIPAFATGTGAPMIACTAGRDYYVDGNEKDLWFCQADDSWRRLSNSGHSHSVLELVDGASLLRPDTSNLFAAGSRQTTQASATTAGLQIKPSALPSLPQSGDVAVDGGDFNKMKWYDGTAWQAAGGGGAGRYGQPISGGTSYTVTGATHGLGSCDVQVQVWDDASPARSVEPDSVTCDGTSKDIVVTFVIIQAGRLVIQ